MSPPSKVGLIGGGEGTKASLTVFPKSVQQAGHENTGGADAGSDK